MERLSTRVAVACLALVAAHLLDRWALDLSRTIGPIGGDAARFARIIGFAPAWLVVATVLWLEGRGRDATLQAAAVAIVLAVTLGGLGAEALKLVVRRERPGEELGYVFRAFTDAPLRTKRLGMPSGHTAVAFAGAAVLAIRFPRIAPLLFGLAGTCAISRVLSGAHYLSDVVAAAIGATWLGRALARDEAVTRPRRDPARRRDREAPRCAVGRAPRPRAPSWR